MSRRAVGGASAVGCGVFGLGGLLVGVAIVVWLGSIALDGSSNTLIGGRRSGKATTTATPSAATGAVVLIEPPAGLDDGTEVRVRGTGLPAGSVSLTVCLTHEPAGGGSRCDRTTARVVAVGADGKLAASRTVARVITVNGTAYDCAAAAGACSLRAQPNGRPGDPGVAAALRFATGLPPSDAQTPPTG